MTPEIKRKYEELSDYGYKLCLRLGHVAPEIRGTYMIYHDMNDWLMTYQTGDEDYEFLVISDDTNYLIEEAWSNYCTVYGGCDDYGYDDGA